MNTIFKKQFYFFTATLFVCLGMLSVGMIQAFSTFCYNTVETEVRTWHEKLIVMADNNTNNTEGTLNIQGFIENLQVIDKYSDKSFIILDENFKVLWVSSTINQEKVGTVVDDKKIEKVLYGQEVAYKKNFGGFFNTKMYTVCYPVRVTDSNGTSTVRAIACISSSIDELSKAMNACYKILIVFLAITILLGFVLSYYLSKMIAKPLGELNEAAKFIAGGNFEKRIRLDYDDEIGQLANSFNEMASSLYLQEKSRREFLSNISHDLRSPLTSMRGFLQAILDGTIPEDKRDRYLKIILDETERLAKLANNILEINKLEESAELNIRTFDVNELITHTLSTFEERAAGLSIALQTELCNDTCYVSADDEKIQRVLYNLVDNALKFTHKYGFITVITELSKDGKKVFVTVKDNGKGVSEAEQKKVFERLYKADMSRGKDKKGTGLGLSIVREFIKAHNETITLKSEVGKGCAFTFTLTLSND